MRAFAGTKRVIGCTTSGASKYRSLLANISVSAIMLEEAGEILEAHVLAALQPSAQRLVMIGDHKQLPPKVSDFKLQVRTSCRGALSPRSGNSLLPRKRVAEAPAG